MTALLGLEPLARTGEAAKSGPIGLAVILLLIIACYFLFKSMSKHMRNVREDFPSDEQPAVPPEPDDPRHLPGEKPSGSAVVTNPHDESGTESESATTDAPPSSEPATEPTKTPTGPDGTTRN